LDALEHCAATGKHDVLEKDLFDVSVALHDRVVGVLVNSVLTQVGHVGGNEKQLRALQSLFFDGDFETTGEQVDSLGLV